MLHTLHCVVRCLHLCWSLKQKLTLHRQDYLRKSVELDYYPQILMDRPNVPNHRMHLGSCNIYNLETIFTTYSHFLDHCIELLRQTVACYADITTVPRPYTNDRVRWLSDTDRVHTCRNLGSIREWVAERSEADQIRQGLAGRAQTP